MALFYIITSFSLPHCIMSHYIIFVCQACGQNDVPAILNSSALIPDLRVLTISNVHVSDPVKGLAAPGIRFGFAVAIVMILVLMIAVSTAYAWVTNRSQDSFVEILFVTEL